MVESKGAITLYLTPWQKRMLRDFMPGSLLKGIRIPEINKMTILPGKIVCPMSYKIPARGMRKGDWIVYLTDEQMTMVREVMGSRVAIPSINVTTDLLNSGAITFSK